MGRRRDIKTETVYFLFGTKLFIQMFNQRRDCRAKEVFSCFVDRKIREGGLARKNQISFKIFLIIVF